MAALTSAGIPRTRREALAAVAGRHDLWVVEEDPLGPLDPERPDPVAALLPERVCHIASAAKVLALGCGCACSPPRRRRSRGWPLRTTLSTLAVLLHAGPDTT